MVNCDLNSEGLVKTEHKWPEANDLTVGLWETLRKKAKVNKKKNKEKKIGRIDKKGR